MVSPEPPPFDPNVPEFPSDSLASSQPELINNFLQLFDAFKKNHVSLDAGALAGNHTIIELLEQNNALQTDVNEISVYTKDVANQTDQIFLRYQGNGQEFQFTNYQLYSLVPTATQTSYFTFLPGKIIVYFGTFTNPKNGVVNLYPPIAKNIMSVSFCPLGTTPSNASYKPQVRLQPPENGFYKSFTALSSTIRALPSCYYLVMANI